LTWIGKEQRPRLEPRILLADPAKSHHATAKVTDQDIFDNKLIFGDNLLALKALERDYAGKVKCVFIDPPYSTGSAFTHYDDGLEHSIWLGLMRDRLEIIHTLLSDDGSLWMTIDDNEAHYLKVMCDEIFGRGNFVANVVWQKVYAPKNAARYFSVDHDSVLVFAKKIEVWTPNLMPRTEKQNSSYKNIDNDPRGLWRADNLSVSLTSRNSGGQFDQSFYSKDVYEVVGPTGKVFSPPVGNSWRVPQAKFLELDADKRVWWGKDGDHSPALKRFLSETKDGRVPQTLWFFEEVGHTQDAKKEVTQFNSEAIFPTPKPESLIKRVLDIATNEGDIVLDSFAGSGTTGAVAHKMRRRWIMVELSEHCHTHVIPRLHKVINGADQGGASKVTGWTGGGGFQYYKIAPSLMQKDQWGNWIINRQYNKEMLREALCKIEGYRYEPSDTYYWQHGQGSETDFIHVTTQNLSDAQLNALSEAVGDGRSLLIVASAWRCPNLDKYPNLTLKKIPNSIAKACEWGRDDYSLNVENLPMSQPVAKAKTHSNNSNSKDSPSKVRAKPIDDHMDELFEGDA